MRMPIDPKYGLRIGAVVIAAGLMVGFSLATVLPGLIDVHAHIIPDIGYTQDSFLKRSSAFNAIDGLVHAQ